MFRNEDIKEEKITVLGITFNTEEERRAYFRKELRKKLPELKQMEGFPIGEDEDILKLSDPPYYTACPNPWLNDFIEEWEEEKKDLEEQGKRVVDFKVSEPYAADISEGKNNPIYNAHSYHTKVPHPAIMRYILHYTQPGDILFDGFAGTGMTGVAASMCENPTSEFKYLIEHKNPNVQWGARRSICKDLSPFASYIAYNYNFPRDVEALEFKVDGILEEIKSEIIDLFLTETESGKLVEFDSIVWSEVFICENCSNEIIFYDTFVNEETGKVSKDAFCPHCKSSITKRKLDKCWETKFDPILNDSVSEAKLYPVRIIYKEGRRKTLKKLNSSDFERIIKAHDEYSKISVPIVKLVDGHNTRQPIRSNGLEFVHRFYFERTLVFLSKLYDRLNPQEYLIFTSQLTNLSKQNRHRPGVSFPYNPLNGVLYISSQISEANPFKAYSNKLKRIIKALGLIKVHQVAETGSATQNAIQSNSIDYIFTDPPFGANIMYSELNYCIESWLKVRTNNNKEAIENKIQNKSILDYHYLMSSSFQEFHRILKPGKWMTVEFSNTSAAIWNGIQTALQNAGFIIANVASIDKMQGSFKAVTTPTAVKQDLIISCYKPSSKFDIKFKKNENTNMAVWNFVEEHLNHLPIHLIVENATTAIIERSPKILFDRLIAFYVQRSLPVPIDAGKFQLGLRERFIERDGMFFTNEQVQEYDKKKKENPEFTQMSLFVSSEQNGVMWLKYFLADKSLTYQDIQPQWMQALAGVRKGDMIPELAIILEENFLKDASGKWYAPDPENEADLEKLRKGRLLRLFEGYKKEIENPRTKIKEVRVEALREGFKQCYQDKNFKTIVTVGDRIPNNLLMEDEVLLQFYDIASSRV